MDRKYFSFNVDKRVEPTFIVSIIYILFNTSKNPLELCVKCKVATPYIYDDTSRVPTL